MNKAFKIMMIMVIFLAIVFSVLNFISIESQAGISNLPPDAGGDSYTGTSVILPDGTVACQGSPLNCYK